MEELNLRMIHDPPRGQDMSTLPGMRWTFLSDSGHGALPTDSSTAGPLPRSSFGDFQTEALYFLQIEAESWGYAEGYCNRDNDSIERRS